jgi:hypothetical protein
MLVSIVPLLLAVVAEQEEEQCATHESRLILNSPPAVAHPLNEAVQVETSQPVLFQYYFWIVANAPVIGHCFSLFERSHP